jgi:transaldolase
MNLLDQLREMTTVVGDTGEIEAIRKHLPQDATTNPSLLYKAVSNGAYRHLVDEAIEFGRSAQGGSEKQLEACLDKLFVNFGTEILKIIPGRVSTEVDARLSFDIDGTIRKAERLIELYDQVGIGPERVLIKVASTWEGVLAAQRLERTGIHCNMTLQFSFPQAAACADAGVTLVSPFVGRVYDWYKKARNVDDIPPEEDPGVQLVRRVYAYYKQHNYPTQVMGASFRHVGQVLALAGCDLLTISPKLLEELSTMQGRLERKLSPDAIGREKIERVRLDEDAFRWQVNEDSMATEKLAEGIRIFRADLVKLAERVEEFMKTPATASR